MAMFLGVIPSIPHGMLAWLHCAAVLLNTINTCTNSEQLSVFDIMYVSSIESYLISIQISH